MWMDWCAIFINWFIGMTIGWFWYSWSGFGKIWAKETWGDLKRWEAAWDKTSQWKPMFWQALSTMGWNMMMWFLVHHVYTPRTWWDMWWMGAFIWGMWFCTAFPKVWWEQRSWTVFWINASHHLIQCFVPICMFRMVWKMPLSPLQRMAI